MRSSAASAAPRLSAVTATAPRSKSFSIAGQACPGFPSSALFGTRAFSSASVPEPLGRVDRREGLRGHTGRARVDHGQRQVLRARAGAEGDHEQVRGARVRDELLLAGQHERVAVRLALQRDAGRREHVARLEQRQRADPGPVGQARQPARLLLGAARIEDRGRGQGGRHERGGEERAPGLVQQHHQVHPGEPGAALLLGNGQAEPAQLGQLLPQLGRVARPRLHDLAHLLERAARVEELAHFRAQQLLLFRESEVHAVFRSSLSLVTESERQLQGAPMKRTGSRGVPGPTSGSVAAGLREGVLLRSGKRWNLNILALR